MKSWCEQAHDCGVNDERTLESAYIFLVGLFEEKSIINYATAPRKRQNVPSYLLVFYIQFISNSIGFQLFSKNIENDYNFFLSFFPFKLVYGFLYWMVFNLFFISFDIKYFLKIVFSIYIFRCLIRCKIIVKLKTFSVDQKTLFNFRKIVYIFWTRKLFFEFELLFLKLPDHRQNSTGPRNF